MESLDIVVLLNVSKNLNDEELAKFCRISRKFKNFCRESNTLLWQQRFIKSLGKYYEKMNQGPALEIINRLRVAKNMSWMRYYFYVMSALRDYFILIKEIHDNDLLPLINVMEKEPFHLYLEDMYRDNLNLNEDLYKSLTEQDKQWVSPDALLYHIIQGNITDPEIINFILSFDFPVDTIDTIANSLTGDESLETLSIVLAILEKMLLKELTPQDRGYVTRRIEEVENIMRQNYLDE